MNSEAPAASRQGTVELPQAMIVIPCLNEAEHIGRLVADLSGAASRHGMRIVVADGGSTDGTLEILSSLQEKDGCVTVLDNRKRIQSSAINLAVDTFGDSVDCFIRIDAHADYPEDFCDRLIEEAAATGADSVVVAMETRGKGPLQKAAAMAQNSKLGNGGSKHREGAPGQWIDHGHHALMRVEPFRAVGGYDETFGHNEDAELDHRLRQAGYRIWLTNRTHVIYYPRDTVAGLFRQYLNYGRGRASNMLKHRTMPKIRQSLPAMILPAAAGAMMALFQWWAAVPVVLWMLICLGYGVAMGLTHRDPRAFLSGVSVMVMHFAWSAGFWLRLVERRKKTT